MLSIIRRRVRVRWTVQALEKQKIRGLIDGSSSRRELATAIVGLVENARQASVLGPACQKRRAAGLFAELQAS